MIQNIWLHIGTAKSGTTALQHFCADNRAQLEAAGLGYVTIDGHSSVNKLAIAINKGREAQLAQFQDQISRHIRNSRARTVLISSEMLFGMAPENILKALPVLQDYPLNLLVYLRRQDRYIESKYLQKLKNGRFRGTIWDYIDKFDGSGSDYYAELRPWFNLDCDVHPRICERSALIGGSTVTDAMAVMGFDELAQAVPETRVENVSPSLGRIQLLQALSDAGHPKTRRIQRALPPDPNGKARFLTQAQRRTYVAQYQRSNEAIRQSFFPAMPQLFATDDLEGPDAAPPEGYTPEQIAEITELFKLVLQTQT